MLNVASCRMIQVERDSAELRSDEIESRVNSGSMDGLNVTLRPRALPTSATAQSLASSTSPPTSGRSTPKHHARNASHQLGIMTLVRGHTHTHTHTSNADTHTLSHMHKPHTQTCTHTQRQKQILLSLLSPLNTKHAQQDNILHYAVQRYYKHSYHIGITF